MPFPSVQLERRSIYPAIRCRDNGVRQRTGGYFVLPQGICEIFAVDNNRMELPSVSHEMQQTGFSGLIRKVEAFGASDVIFDLDGTLIDSAPGIVGTINHALASLGIAPVRLVDHSIVGPPIESMFDLLLEEHDREHRDDLIDRYKRYYDHEGYRESTVFDGVSETMSTLERMGVGMHIATNKRLAPTMSILSYFGWEDNFSSVYAVDSHGTRFASKADMLAKAIENQALEKDRVLYVGDTKHDEEAAAANDIGYYHAFWGYEHQ